MTNHPHDCPVCEEGGHCHLQDMTVMTAHHSRSYWFDKRTHLNQDLGPFIGHEMNRCISCYRCVRYYKDYADGRSEEHTYELQSLMRRSYAGFCLKKKKNRRQNNK